jgi:hypothetical protein
MKPRALFLTGLLVFLAAPAPAGAVCPVCTVAVGAGLGVSRWIGIDDSVTGVWVGGLVLSSGLWLADWMRRRGWRLPYAEAVSIGLFFLFVIPPLYWADTIGIPGNILWGIDKVLLGTMAGSLVFLLGVVVDKWLRTINEGKVFVYYQKVIIPLFLLSLTSYFFYLITN